MLGYIILTIFILLLIELYLDHNHIKVSQFVIPSRKIPAPFQGFRIVQLSDLHSKEFGNENEKLLKKIQELKPDVIVMTGDMINGRKDNHHIFLKFAENLSKMYPIYYVEGNHEEYMTNQQKEELLSTLIQNHIYVLDNQGERITKENQSIFLYGVWNSLEDYCHPDAKTPIALLEDVRKKMQSTSLPKESFHILLAHNPNDINTYAMWGADLVLSGHIHGGMIRLPFIGGIFSPETYFFPKYSKGMYQVNGKRLIVSTGLGRGSRGFRLFNRPEINLIILETEER